MAKENQERKQKDYVGLAIVIYLIAGFSILKYYRYLIDPDAVSYIGIAQKYLAGNFGDAINGYWSPLLSWLLAPLLFIGIEPLLAIRILNLLIGPVVILVMALILRQFSISAGVRRAILLITIPATLSFAMVTVTPDLLITLIILIYFLIVFKTDYAATKRNGILCGFWGGLAYLTKSYCFPFFISHFVLMNLFCCLKYQDRETRLKVVTNFICGLAVFGVISGIWITTLSLKYHKLTYSTAGNYNISLIHPKEGESKHPMLYQGLLVPPNPTAISMWEDPSFIKISKWSPFESPDAFKYYLNHIGKNIGKTYDFFKEISIWVIPIIIAGILFLLQKPEKILTQHQILYPIVSIFLYALGYNLVMVERRYLWPIFFLILILGGYITDKLFQSSFFTKTRKAGLYILFIIPFIYGPIVPGLLSTADANKTYYSLSQYMKTSIRPGDRIASNDEWEPSLYAAYYLNVQYYGIPKNNIDKQILYEELRKYNINRYLIWDRKVLNGVEDLHVNVGTIQW